MICRSCYGYRLCLKTGRLHIGILKVKDSQERWDRLWPTHDDRLDHVRRIRRQWNRDADPSRPAAEDRR